jgi:signal peptidase
VVARFARRTTSLLAGLVVLLVIAYGGLFAAGYRPVAVYSGSMVPALGVGSLAVDRTIPSSRVRRGDVITFADPYVRGRVVTHRVVGVYQTPHGPAYRTKGDANPTRDPWTIALPPQVGKVSFDVPYAGYALVYAQTREVRLGLIVAAALAALSGLLRAIWRRPAPEPV